MVSQSDMQELINRRRRQVLVHSFLYYRLDYPIIEDYKFDRWSKELAELQEQYPEVASGCIYASEFKEFDGSTGYNLPLGDTWVYGMANKLLQMKKRSWGNL